MIAQFDDLLLADIVDMIERDAGGFFDRGQRNGKFLIAAFDKQRSINDERQRQLDGKARPFAQFGFDFNRAAEFGDVCFDNIHADAAPGNRVDHLFRRKARRKNKLDRVVIRHAFDFCHRAQPFFRNGFAHALHVDAVAVVDDFDNDVIALFEGVQVNCAFSRFAFRLPRFWQFDAVRHGIPHKVHERIGNFVDDRFIELGIFAR